MSTIFPVSDHLKTRGVVYFARMIDKIRLNTAGKLPADYVTHLGFVDNTSFDSRFCRFWELDYENVKARALKGGTAEDVFDDLFAGRQPLNVEQVFVWNLFLLKRGWRDSGTPGVVAEKAAAGVSHRSDIHTYVDMHDFEEGREPQPNFN
jgi:gluconokinase